MDWRMGTIALTMAVSLVPASAQIVGVQAACEPPTPPAASDRPVKPAAPERPRCAASGACEPGEADAYNKAIAAFNAKARGYTAATQAYAARLNAYVAAAEAYARCEVTALSSS